MLLQRGVPFLIPALFVGPALGQTVLNVSHRAAEAHFILQDGVNNINSGENHETNLTGVFDPTAVTADPQTFASLVSFMGPTLASAESLVDATTIQIGQGQVSAFAQTNFDYGFTTDRAMPCALEIEYEGVEPDQGGSFALVFQSVGGGELLNLSSAAFGPNTGEPTALSSSFQGELPPGQYLLNVFSTPSHRVAGGGVVEFFPTRYTLSLRIGLPGDINGDCAVDTADLGLLIAGFGGADPSEDLNGDGVVDTADLGLVIAGFGAGCP